jgi:hypothetical protein
MFFQIAASPQRGRARGERQKPQSLADLLDAMAPM